MGTNGIPVRNIGGNNEWGFYRKEVGQILFNFKFFKVKGWIHGYGWQGLGRIGEEAFSHEIW